MALRASWSKNLCGTCGNKSAGILRCEGCLQTFCRKHLNEHRALLSHQLDEVILEHDALQQTIVASGDKENHHLSSLKEVDKWEKDSIFKIQKMAENTRQQVMQAISLGKVSKELCDLAQGLQNARIDEDYAEPDLRTWMDTLQKLKDDVNETSPVITIQEDPKQTLVAKIFISTKTTLTPRRKRHTMGHGETAIVHPISTQYSGQEERFGESFGNIRIEDYNRVATQTGPKSGAAFVRGVREYSSGKHNIPFLFEKKTVSSTVSFAVVSKLLPIFKMFKHEQYSSYEWLSDDRTVPADPGLLVNEKSRDISGQIRCEIEFQLDCDNRKISYFNRKTTNRREMNVDIAKCPFPWHVQFYLNGVGDCIRLLPQ